MVFRYRPVRSRRRLVLAAALVVGSSQVAFAENSDIEVLIDEATLLPLERPAAEIIVGNPSVADVAVQNGKSIVLTGKSFGETNLIVLDAEGKTIISRRVHVQEPAGGYLTVYKGSRRQTLYCSPNCETPLVIGDDVQYFEALSKEIKSKQAISQASAQGDKQED